MSIDSLNQGILKYLEGETEISKVSDPFSQKKRVTRVVQNVFAIVVDDVFKGSDRREAILRRISEIPYENQLEIFNTCFDIQPRESGANTVIQKEQSGANTVIEIAKRCALQDGKATAEHIKSFGITNEEDLFEIAKLCVQQNPWDALTYITSFGIHNEAYLFEIAMLCAKEYGGSTAEHITNFGITNQTYLVAIAEDCARQDGRMTAMYIQRFNIRDQKALHRIANLCVRQDEWNTPLYIKNFGIKDSADLFDIAAVCARKNGVATAENYKYFGITNEADLFAIAKICAQQDGKGPSEERKVEETTEVMSPQGEISERPQVVLPPQGEISERPQVVLPPQGEISEHLKAVYTVANGGALLNCDFSKSPPIGVITLRIGDEKSKRYIKLRGLDIQRDVSDTEKTNWIAVGNPVKFYIRKNDFSFQLAFHYNKDRFGDFAEIEKAGKAFQAWAGTPIRELAFQEEVAGVGKLTTGMDSEGHFRVIEKKELGQGAFKKVDKGIILTEQGHPQKAMAKLHGSFKEDDSRVKVVRQEAEISQMLRKAQVPHVLDIQVTPGQNLKKVRLDMPLIKSEEFQEEKRETKIKYMSQLAETLAGLHRNGWTHNDIKSANVLFDKEKGEVFLIDFGEASKFEDAARPSAGTYPAPEAASVEVGVPLHIDKSKAEKNDCWAFGVTLYEMMHGSKDPGVSRKIDAEACWRSGRASICAFAQEVRAKLESSQDPVDQLIVALLSEDPAERPAMDGVVKILCSQGEEKPLPIEEGQAGNLELYKKYDLSDEIKSKLCEFLEAPSQSQSELVRNGFLYPSDYLDVVWDRKIDPKGEIRDVWKAIVQLRLGGSRVEKTSQQPMHFVFDEKYKGFNEEIFSKVSYVDWVKTAIALLPKEVAPIRGDQKVKLSDDEQKIMVTLVAQATAQILIPEMENKLGKESDETRALECLPPERKRALAWVTAELMGKGGDPQADTTAAFKRFAPPDPTEEERGIVSKFLTKLREEKPS